MEKINTLAAESRDKSEQKLTTLRKSGLVPGVVYGGSEPPINVSIKSDILKNESKEKSFFSKIYNLKIGDRVTQVIPRDIQYDPVTDFPLHVDFYRLTKGKKIVLEIPVNFINREKSPGIKKGGVLNVVRRSIELKCSVESIPTVIEIDLDGLEIGDSIHISSIALPENTAVTITDRDFTIATVAAPTVYVEEEKPAEEEKAEGEEAEAAEGEEDKKEEAAAKGEEKTEAKDKDKVKDKESSPKEKKDT
jgi:large subunit ribosomal protein L25